MNLSVYDGKYVRITDTDGNSFSGRAKYGNTEFPECEWGLDEDGIFIEDVIICNSQIESIEEIVPHGSAELWTEHLILRRYRPDDAGQLYECVIYDSGCLLNCNLITELEPQSRPWVCLKYTNRV